MARRQAPTTANQSVRAEDSRGNAIEPVVAFGPGAAVSRGGSIPNGLARAVLRTGDRE
jgi:hypothetical protein